ncbi:hypothetical protein TYRP_017806 [Tyrophagus putrescentiae]|nr:hypothetical protein TYRP_017806 [Tyrophagus putrescentiae]
MNINALDDSLVTYSVFCINQKSSHNGSFDFDFQLVINQYSFLFNLVFFNNKLFDMMSIV